MIRSGLGASRWLAMSRLAPSRVVRHGVRRFGRVNPRQVPLDRTEMILLEPLDFRRDEIVTFVGSARRRRVRRSPLLAEARGTHEVQ